MDELTDLTRYNGLLDSDIGANYLGTPYSLFLTGCDDASDEAAIAILWGEFIEPSKYLTVTYRIDDLLLTEDDQWLTSKDGDTTYQFDDAKQIIQDLSSGSQLIARVTPYSGGPITGTWNLDGIEIVVNTIAETCGW